MKTDNKKPLVSGRTQGANKNTVKKNHTIMNELVTRPLNRFQAEEIGDHCLPSTISSLKTLHGLEFPRRWVKVPNRFGGETSVKEYSTSEEDKRKIDEILGAVE
jgi:hypothetical protein